MRNMLRMLEKANEEYIPFRREELGVEPHIFEEIAKRCGFKPVFKMKGKLKYIKLRKSGIPVVMLYDTAESDKFNYIDLADIHAGHRGSSMEILENILQKYSCDGVPKVDYVFIAGDLFEGLQGMEFTYELVKCNPRFRAQAEAILEYQVNLVFNVISKYDFDYRAIYGNHDYTFEQVGLESPLKLLQEKMRAAGKRFTYYDTYLVDFIIAGVAKRVMHLESYHKRDGAVHAYDRITKFKEHGGLEVHYNGKTFPIRLFHCGHIHRREELYDSRDKIYISQPGSFIKQEMLYSPVIHVKGTVLEDKRIVRD